MKTKSTLRCQLKLQQALFDISDAEFREKYRNSFTSRHKIVGNSMYAEELLCHPTIRRRWTMGGLGKSPPPTASQYVYLRKRPCGFESGKTLHLAK